MIIDEAITYANKLMEENEFKELLRLKKEIDTLYKSLIIRFKTLESKYSDALKYKEYYPDFKALQKSFQEAKVELYSKAEVKEYFKYERKVAQMLEEDTNRIKSSISNKFKNNSSILI